MNARKLSEELDRFAAQRKARSLKLLLALADDARLTEEERDSICCALDMIEFSERPS